MIQVILWDVDGTLLDFAAAERAAIRKCFEVFHLGECTDLMLQQYSAINKRYWEMLERGEMTKPEILVGRFREFFAISGIDTDCAEAFNAEYQLRLGDTICFCDDSYHLVSSLCGKVKQYAVTNGTRIAQDKKLRNSGLIDLFDGVFISENLGVEKPGIGFFKQVFEQIGSPDPRHVMIVGDSLTSDMLGGNRAGIVCCWYNPEHKPNHSQIYTDAEIDDLRCLPEILKKF